MKLIIGLSIMLAFPVTAMQQSVQCGNDSADSKEDGGGVGPIPFALKKPQKTTIQIKLLGLKMPTKPAAAVAAFKNELETKNMLFSDPKISTIQKFDKTNKEQLILLSAKFQDPIEINRILFNELQRYGATITERIVGRTVEINIDSQVQEKRRLAQEKREQATKRLEELRRQLPENVSFEQINQVSYETIGTTIKVYLHDHMLPHKELIANLLLATYGQFKRVVRKTEILDREAKLGEIIEKNIFRIARLENLAGQPGFDVEVKLYGMLFQFELDKTYWSSNQAHEHGKLVDSFEPGQIIVDGFAGVGPYALLAAQKGCRVFANDLNPDAHRYLLNNKALNNIGDNLIVEENPMDGGAFIRHVVAKLNQDDAKELRLPDHFIINLPASSVDFAKYFLGLNYSGNSEQPAAREIKNFPMVHFYTFARAGNKADSKEAAIEAVKAGFNGLVEPLIEHARSTKKVGKSKLKYCVSVKLNEAVLNAKPVINIE